MIENNLIISSFHIRIQPWDIGLPIIFSSWVPRIKIPRFRLSIFSPRLISLSRSANTKIQVVIRSFLISSSRLAISPLNFFFWKFHIKEHLLRFFLRSGWVPKGVLLLPSLFPIPFFEVDIRYSLIILYRFRTYSFWLDI